VDAAWHELARAVYPRAFRTDLNAPGFALISFQPPLDSVGLRRAMVHLKEELAAFFHRATARHLVFRSMTRFDQQVTTKFHLDGGPDESLLMLGYEPSTVVSQLALADYTMASYKLGIDPGRFVVEHNPMFTAGARLLEPFTTPLTVFEPSQTHILIVNNSCRPVDSAGGNLLGVMHQATIPQPDASRRRIVNSTMLRAAADRADEDISVAAQADYVTTNRVSGRDDYTPA
jgi:hypothetical protein